MNDELRQRLKDAGINADAGAWAQRDPGVRTAGPPKVLLRQRELLLKLKGLLEQQVEQDKTKVAELHEQVARLQHGGGR